MHGPPAERDIPGIRLICECTLEKIHLSALIRSQSTHGQKNRARENKKKTAGREKKWKGNMVYDAASRRRSAEKVSARRAFSRATDNPTAGAEARAEGAASKAA